jgi:ankyrin repeat protein
LQANVDEVNSDKVPRLPLHIAAEKGHLAVVVLLCAAGATVDARDDEFNTPLMLAAAGNHHECVLYLMERGASPHLKVTEYSLITRVKPRRDKSNTNVRSIILI